MNKNRNEVRVGIVGLGSMGKAHAKGILDGRIPGVKLVAVCDQPTVTEGWSGVEKFSDAGEMFQSGVVEAVVIATPHFSHTTLGMQALQAGLHVLVEKPLSVHKADCEELLRTPRRPDQVFAVMFQMRLRPVYQKIKALIDQGELGQIRRMNWTITDWFRTEAYYRSGSWRATWKGEGGGVLINQCPHQLDLWQWFFGMPRKVYASCGFGKYHAIEVEDDVTAVMEYANGAVGVFTTSTGEAPGSNRLEIVGERGLLVLENNQLRFQRNEIPMTEYSQKTPLRQTRPPFWEVTIPVGGEDPGHCGLLQNFADAILGNAALVSPAEEGIHSVELANAMLLSGFLGSAIELPLDGKLYQNELNRRMLQQS